MSILIVYQPGGSGAGSIAKLVWQSSQALLAATRAGRRDLAEKIGPWMVGTREDPRCTPALRRVIDSALSIAMRQFGGTAPTFEGVQTDDGEAA